MIRAHIIVKGKVQGVNFRYYFAKIANQAGLTGWVKNSGNYQEVEAVLEGEETDIKRLLAWCWKGPPRSEITDVKTTMEKYQGEFTKFKIKR